MTKFIFGICQVPLILTALSWSTTLFAETPRIKILITPSTDSSSYNLGPALQKMLFSFFKDTPTYNPIESDTPLSGFGSTEVNQALSPYSADALSFTLLEQNRISVFLFDRKHPAEFIVSSHLLTDAHSATEITTYINKKFESAFNEVLRFHKDGRYQDVKKSNSEPPDTESPKFKGREVRTVRYYVGAGRVVGGNLDYRESSPSGGSLGLASNRDFTEKNRLHFVLGSSGMFNDRWGYELLFQNGILSTSGLTGSDAWFALHLSPRIEVRPIKNIRLWGTLGLGINLVLNRSSYDGGNLKIFTNDDSKFALGFSQGLGLQVDLSEKYFIGLNTIHQSFTIKELSSKIFVSSPASTTEIKWDITYDNWVTFLIIGAYFDWLT